MTAAMLWNTWHKGKISHWSL